MIAKQIEPFRSGLYCYAEYGWNGQLASVTANLQIEDDYADVMDSVAVKWDRRADRFNVDGGTPFPAEDLEKFLAVIRHLREPESKDVRSPGRVCDACGVTFETFGHSEEDSIDRRDRAFARHHCKPKKPSKRGRKKKTSKDLEEAIELLCVAVSLLEPDSTAMTEIDAFLSRVGGDNE